MNPLEKARAVAAIRRPDAIDVRSLYESLRAALHGYLVALTGDADRDLDRVEISSIEDDWGAVYSGFSSEGVGRLWCAVRIEEEGRAEIALVLTTGDLLAGPELFGQRGAKIGRNPVLLARLLHVALVTLRTGGVRMLRNEPVNEALAAYYRGLGFVDDPTEPGWQNLNLDDVASLAKAFHFVQAAYEDWGLSLDLPP